MARRRIKPNADYHRKFDPIHTAIDRSTKAGRAAYQAIMRERYGPLSEDCRSSGVKRFTREEIEEYERNLKK